MAAKLLSVACMRTGRGGLSPARPHYPNGGTISTSLDEEKCIQGSETKALFSVTGMTCSACAASVEKAVKRLPGIKEAVVDVLNHRAQVRFCPAFVNEEKIQETIEDAGFQAKLIEEERNEKSTQVCRIRIQGLTCISCSMTLEYYLVAMHGVQKALVALSNEQVEVHYDPRLLTHNQILEAIEDIGFDGILISNGEDIKCKVHLQVEGLQTENSIIIIQNSLKALPGVQETTFEPEIRKLTIFYESNLTGPRDFIETIQSSQLGTFKAMIFPERGGRETHREDEIKEYYRSFLWSLVFTVPVFLMSMVIMYIPGINHGLETKAVNMLTIGEILRWLLTTPVQFIIGRRFYIGSYKALRHGSANMDVLIALGTNAAYFYSVYSVLGTFQRLRTCIS